MTRDELLSLVEPTERPRFDEVLARRSLADLALTVFPMGGERALLLAVELSGITQRQPFQKALPVAV